MLYIGGFKMNEKNYISSCLKPETYKIVLQEAYMKGQTPSKRVREIIEGYYEQQK